MKPYIDMAKFFYEIIVWIYGALGNEENFKTMDNVEPTHKRKKEENFKGEKIDDILVLIRCSCPYL